MKTLAWRTKALLGIGAAALPWTAVLWGGCDGNNDFGYICGGRPGEVWGQPDPCPPCTCVHEDYCGGASSPDAEGCGDAGTDAGETPDGDASAGGGGGAGGGMSALCGGQCVPKEPIGWSEPALLWIGPPDSAPDCPVTAPTLGYEGYADLRVEPSRCAPCACDPPDASCVLPTAWSAVDTSTCTAGPDAQRTSFAAPDGWDGACTTANAIPAGQPCTGGPCAQSLDIPAPTVLSGACAPYVLTESPWEHRGSVAWATFARACVGVAAPPCADPGMTCTPAPPGGDDAAPPETFSTCVARAGENECPTTYPSRHVFYAGTTDTRDCTACTCGDAIGATCSIVASAFSDAACSVFVGGVMVSSEAPLCLGVVAGTALGSKSASVVDLDPGYCVSSGGEATGDVEPDEATTFCCREAAV